jgi:hypothetical protein
MSLTYLICCLMVSNGLKEVIISFFLETLEILTVTTLM